MYSVYVHINKINGKRYVGITSRDVNTRWKNGYGYSKNLPIRRAFDKYGWDNFEHNVLFSGISEDEAKEIEINLIREWKTQDDAYGYNITSGGDGVCGWHPSDETRRKMSESAKKRVGELNSNYGHKWSDEKRKCASKSIMDKGGRSAETRKKLSNAAKERTGERNPFWKHKHTEDTKQKIAVARSKPVVQLNKDGAFVCEYPSVKDASNKLGICDVAISNCCRHLTKTSGGYIWVYKNEYDCDLISS